MERYYEDEITVPSKMNPATTVHKLLAKLLPYLE
ncbi:hypothetical protein H4683_003599 [Filibacter limicola]|uniref:Uncharacterized protein n=1 Tax=Sporosarcina limicola TaxID=34101 RepID=A0A927MKM1_9BACL|nr:hypothetical protein [Sporosarcina limicola]